MRTPARRKCLATRVAWAILGPAVGVPLFGLSVSVAQAAEGALAAVLVGVMASLAVLVLVVAYENATGD